MEIEEAKRRARSGPLMLFARRFFAVGITFVATITIARLVTPEAYGLANMSTVIFSFAQIFRDFGLTNALLRKGEISAEEMNFIFWFNVAATTLLTLLLAGLAPLAADFFDQPVVAQIMLVSAIGFFISGIALQHRSLLTRELRFGAIALIDSAALLIGFVVTLILALQKYEVWALVIGLVAQGGSAALMCVLASGWVPGKLRRPADLGSLLRFGANASVFSMSTFASNNIAAVLIGHQLGPALLGQYNRAQALFNLANANLVQPIAQAAMPLLTRLRVHPEDYRDTYLSLIRKLCVILFPASVIVMFAGVPIVTSLLGTNWLIAGQILSALAPALVAVGIAYSASDLFITQDRSAELRTLGLIEMGIRIACLVIAVPFGVVTAALAFSISTLIVAGSRIFVAGRKGPVSAMDQFRAALAGLPLAIGAGIGCGGAIIFNGWQTPPSSIAALVLIGAGGAAGLALGLLVPVSRRGLVEVGDVFGLSKLRALLTRARSR